MQTVTTIGLDIAKTVFQVHGVDAAGQVVVRRWLKRRYVLPFFQKLPSCLAGIEACASSHYWSRELQALGHAVRLMPRSDFRWDGRRGVCICPNNKVLHTTGTVYDGTLLRYRSSKFDCDVCPLKMKCCPNTSARHVPRDLQEDARDVARRLMGTRRFLKSRDERKRVDMRFAHLKIHHGFERMRLRGLSGARDEFHLAAIVQNLKTLALRSIGPPVRFSSQLPPENHKIDQATTTAKTGS